MSISKINAIFTAVAKLDAQQLQKGMAVMSVIRQAFFEALAGSLLLMLLARARLR